MNKPARLIAPLVLGLLLSACATDGGQPTSASTGVKTENTGAVSGMGTAAATLTVSRMVATVEFVDLATRMVGIVGPEGSGLVLQVGEQVRNLDQVGTGDRVTVEYYEGLAAAINPSASRNEVKVTEALVRSAAGERPAGAAGDAITATVLIEYVDTLRHVVRFKGPLGKTRVVKVMKPEFRTLLKNLKPGDQVELTYFEALAVSVQPAKN
jgi:hypothetical protein